MQDAPQQNDQAAPDSEPLDEQALDHVAGGVDGDCFDDGTKPQRPWDPFTTSPPFVIQ